MPLAPRPRFSGSLARWHELEDYVEFRLTVARYPALAFEFQLAADILSTAIAPSWDQIGKLGAVVVIRTGLNYLLMREMKEERLKGVIPSESQPEQRLPRHRERSGHSVP